MSGKWLLKPWVRPLLFAWAVLPLGYLIWAAATDQLGANPAEALIRGSGDWTLRLLCLVLVVTPLRVATGWVALARFRRMFGLFVFFYALVHALAYAWLDMGLVLTDVLRDIVKRPFILVGFAALLLLLALALTSFDLAIRWLGGPVWRQLHQSVYLVAGLAVLHFFWMRAGKNDFAEVAVYALVLAFLLGWRLRRFISKRAL